MTFLCYLLIRLRPSSTVGSPCRYVFPRKPKLLSRHTCAGGLHPVTAGLATEEQTLDLASEPLVHENVNKRIDCRIARDQNSRANVGDNVRKMVVASYIECQVCHPTKPINDSRRENNLGDSLSYFLHALRSKNLLVYLYRNIIIVYRGLIRILSSTRYLKSERRERVRYRVKHEEIKFVSTR